MINQSPDDSEEPLKISQSEEPVETPGETTPEAVWAIVANIRKEHPFGPGGLETKIGTRQFRGGTKVYIAGCFPGPCDAVVAVGLHRKSRRFITCAVDVRHVENFRVKLVYHPTREPRALAARREVPGARVSADHLRARLHVGGELGSTPIEEPGA